MRFLSFKILVLYILLPPILYVFSLDSLERYLQTGMSGRFGNCLCAITVSWTETCG
ncbi:MAG: hypothetical protein HC887_05025 [Desulfobacteraceae bacterium]|nr:hypothetical protein [Desulfobacteraceae bacterium]